MLDDLGCDRACIELVAALLGNEAESARQSRIGHDLAGTRRPRVLEAMYAAAFVSGEIRSQGWPIQGDPRCDGNAVLGMSNRRRERVAERQRSVCPEQAIPGIDGARHGDRMDARRADLLEAGRPPPSGVGIARCPPRAIEAHDGAVRLPYD